jgi:hypothetical protein
VVLVEADAIAYQSSGGKEYCGSENLVGEGADADAYHMKAKPNPSNGSYTSVDSWFQRSGLGENNIFNYSARGIDGENLAIRDGQENLDKFLGPLLVRDGKDGSIDGGTVFLQDDLAAKYGDEHGHGIRESPPVIR